MVTASRPWLRILLVVSQLTKSSCKNDLILTRVFEGDRQMLVWERRSCLSESSEWSVPVSVVRVLPPSEEAVLTPTVSSAAY